MREIHELGRSRHFLLLGGCVRYEEEIKDALQLAAIGVIYPTVKRSYYVDRLGCTVSCSRGMCGQSRDRCDWPDLAHSERTGPHETHGKIDNAYASPSHICGHWVRSSLSGRTELLTESSLMSIVGARINRCRLTYGDHQSEENGLVCISQ